ncbi:MAG: class I tRNA ligase family protein, partial [Nevskiales bacterium]
RLWKQVAEHAQAGAAPLFDPAAYDADQLALRKKLHETIAKTGDDMGRRMTFNTAIAAVMELLNAVAKSKDDSPGGRALRQEALEAAVLILAPITPHICHQLWQNLGHKTPVLDAEWPEYDPMALVSASVQIVVQVNGKVRGRIDIDPEADEATVAAQALQDANVQRFIEGKTVRKQILVPGKLLNIVVQ